VVQWPFALGHGGVRRAGAHSRSTASSIDAVATTWSLATANTTKRKVLNKTHNVLTAFRNGRPCNICEKAQKM